MKTASVATSKEARYLRPVRGAAALALLSLVGFAMWQLGQVRPPAPYRAPLLNVHLTGAVVGNFGFSADTLNVREVSPSAFLFEAEGGAYGFRLEFKGAPEARRGTYDLSANYPLTLTLFEGEEVSAVFTAYEGTAEFGDEGGRVAASLLDESGRDLFLGAQFPYAEDGACSESYRFCFAGALESGDVARED